MKIIVTMPVNDGQMQRLMNAWPEAEWIYGEHGWLKKIDETAREEAEIILGNVKLTGDLRSVKNLRWIQLNTAGTEGYCEAGILPEDVILTNATGAYGPAIAEHMLGCLLMLQKKLHLYYRNQEKHLWKYEKKVTAIEGSTVLCVGMGDIGGCFAEKMKALGAYTIGVKRSLSEKPAYLDELYTVESLDSLLPRADVVALSMPATGETRHMFNETRLGLMKDTAILLNVGRGSAVDTDALSRMLYEGKLGGVALDVTEPEPLPEDHPIWDAPNTIITPHVSGGFSLPATLDRIVDLCAENLVRYRNGEPLRNVVDRTFGYAR